MFRFLFFTILSSILGSCGQVRATSSLKDTATKEQCETSKSLTLRPESEFPADHKSVIRLVSAEARGTCYPSGWGWRLGEWDVLIEVEVENLAFDKRFQIEPVKQADWFEGRSVLDPRKVVYLGSEAGYDRFRFKGKGITPSKVSVIMPAKFNETPNIGNPVVGWNGPTYGFIIEASGI